MGPSRARYLFGLGLLSTLAFGGVALAAPLPGPLPQPVPQVPAQPLPIDAGLVTSASVSPRDLFDAGVAVDVTRPLRIEASRDRVLMTAQTQLILTFKAAASKGYRIDCRFSGNPSVNVMEFANGAIVRQSRSNPAAGVLNHTVQAAAGKRDVKFFVQSASDTDWSGCTIAPV